MMSSIASKEVVEKVESLIRNGISPKWIESFLEKKYFDKCPSHHDSQKSELNRYCITCDAAISKYCSMSGSHFRHNSLTINRYTYQHVVPLAEMEIYIDCEKIQPYKCNKKAVVSLNPLSGNGFGPRSEGGGHCRVCKRKLVEGDRFVFCSLACKIQAITEMVEQLRAHDNGTTENKEDDKENDRQPVNPSKRKRSQKGIPIRAPLH